MSTGSVNTESTSESNPRSSGSRSVVRDPDRARKALGRYRVMAWVTGVMLLVLCVEMAMKYLLNVSDDVMRWIEWIPFAHGWVYVVYLITVVGLWSAMRWGLGRLATMVLGGVVPVLSFVVERRVHRDVLAQIGPGAGSPEVRPATITLDQ